MRCPLMYSILFSFIVGQNHIRHYRPPGDYGFGCGSLAMDPPPTLVVAGSSHSASGSVEESPKKVN